MSVVQPSTSRQLERVYAARRLTRRLALSHYENFTVVSIALPRHLRQDFCNIYAFCRHADDLADEIESPHESLRLLDEFRTDLLHCYSGLPKHPYLLALQETIQRFSIPIDPFLKLIDAFEQDQRVTRYATYQDLLSYCQRSADPVGHLVLYLCGFSDAQRQTLSNYTCTALQLANFWQDVVPDLGRGRIYIPQEDMDRFGVREADLHERRFTVAFSELMRFEVDRADALFTKGQALLPLLPASVRKDIALYGQGGCAILDLIRGVGYNVLKERPALSKWAKMSLLLRSVAKSL